MQWSFNNCHFSNCAVILYYNIATCFLSVRLSWLYLYIVMFVLHVSTALIDTKMIHCTISSEKVKSHGIQILWISAFFASFVNIALCTLDTFILFILPCTTGVKWAKIFSERLTAEFIWCRMSQPRIDCGEFGDPFLTSIILHSIFKLKN